LNFVSLFNFIYLLFSVLIQSEINISS
jgi:hypothetical protein